MSTVTPPNGLGAGELDTRAVTRATPPERPAQGALARDADPVAVTASREAPAGEDANAAAAPATDAEDAAAERARELAQQLVDDALKPFAKLQITRDEASDRFIYTTIDSRSGEIIQQFPREELLNALASPQDAEGVVVDRRV